MFIYLLTWSNQSSSADNVTSQQIIRRGRIRVLDWSVQWNSITDNDSLTVELSKVPIIQTTSGSLGPVGQVRAVTNFVTSGLSLGGINKVVHCDIVVNPLEYLYINLSVSGSGSTSGSVLVHVQEGGK